MALIFTMSFSLLSLLTSVMQADTVFILLMSIAGISVTISWMGIAASQLMFRYRYVKAGGKTEDLKFKVPFYPFVPIFCIAFCLLILGFLAFDPTQRIGLLYGIGFFVACMVFYKVKLEKVKGAPSEVEVEAEPVK
jgi:arginine/ornithine permease